MYKYMRLIVMFDLPTLTERDRKTAAKFRKFLLDDGYIMIQFSVYSRICKNSDDVSKHENRLKVRVPSNGNVRMIQVTESQYNSMIVFYNSKKTEEEIGIDPMIVF